MPDLLGLLWVLQSFLLGLAKLHLHLSGLRILLQLLRLLRTGSILFFFALFDLPQLYLILGRVHLIQLDHLLLIIRAASVLAL